MKATTQNIELIAKRNLYREVEGEEFTMTISLDMWNKTQVSFKIENWDGDIIERGSCDSATLCERINAEGWSFDEQMVAAEAGTQEEIENAAPTRPVAQKYTCKNGYVMDVFFVDATMQDKRDWYEIENAVKAARGWKDSRQGGYILRSYTDAERINDMVLFGCNR